MSLIQTLPDGPLDIIGDVHGEADALHALLGHLGYDLQGWHPQGRTLVFVGDFCDRGPDSPAVLTLVGQLVASGRAVAVLGNHELNLLRSDAKDGSGWFFDERTQRDYDKYAPFNRPTTGQRQGIMDFVSSLPLALERTDLRVVHAAWNDDAIQAVRRLPSGSIRQSFDQWEQAIERRAREAGLAERAKAELAAWGASLDDPASKPPVLDALAEQEVGRQMGNPIKVLTSGVERETREPFFTSGRWRFAERVRWWNEYTSATPVVVGHYWRLIHPIDRTAVGKEDPNLFEGIAPLHWHGRRGNVFCVDFSAGGRWRERKSGKAPGVDFKLAALRWPERTVLYDDGSQHKTEGFQA